MENKDTFINYMIDLEATGKNIRTLMKITGYSAREFERILGCSQNAFFKWQKGDNLPSFDNLLRLSGILKTPIEKIVVFKKFSEENLPLKETNAGCIRNNVFFTYNKATECVIRDCLAFKKKFGMYPDKMILNSQTLENWKLRENEETEAELLPDFDYIPDNETLNGEIIYDNIGNPLITTSSFSIQLILKDDIPENYYRLINSENCKI